MNGTKGLETENTAEHGAEGFLCYYRGLYGVLGDLVYCRICNLRVINTSHVGAIAPYALRVGDHDADLPHTVF
jgi:hypothetical protein